MSERNINRKLWTAAVFTFILLAGMTVQIRGALVPTFKSVFFTPDSLVGLVAPAGSLSLMAGVLLVGMRAGKVDFKKLLLIGSGLSALFTFLAGLVPTFSFLLVMLIGRGFFNGSFQGLGRPIISHLHSEDRGRVFNLQELFWALGAVSGPLLVAVVLILGNWRLAYIVPAIGYVLIFILVAWIKVPRDIEKERSLTWDKLRELLGKPLIIGIILIFLLNGGMEGGIFTWLSRYSDQFFTKSFASISLSIYLSSYILGRYTYSKLIGRIGYLKLLLMITIPAAATYSLALIFSGGWLMLVFFFGTGFFVSGVFPTALALGVDHFPGYSGPVNALALSSASLGISIFPPIMGLTMEHFPIAIAMSIPILLYIALISLSVIMKNTLLE